jgi:hypothetical protein
MGAAFNFDTINHCAMFAQESAREDEWPACALFLEIVKLGATAFPEMGGGNDAECFNTLTEFFGECRNLTGKSKKDADANGITTVSCTRIKSQRQRRANGLLLSCERSGREQRAS